MRGYQGTEVRRGGCFRERGYQGKEKGSSFREREYQGTEVEAAVLFRRNIREQG